MHKDGFKNFLLVDCMLCFPRINPALLPPPPPLKYTKHHLLLPHPYPLCESPSSVVVAVLVYYLFEPHFYLWPHSGNTLCLCHASFQPLIYWLRYWVVYSVVNSFSVAFFSSSSRFVSLDLFLMHRGPPTILTLCLFFFHEVVLI